MRPSFYLKDNKADGETPIILNLKIHGKSFRYSIQKSIIPELWDRSIQRPTTSRSLINQYRKYIPSIREDLQNTNIRIERVVSDVNIYFAKLDVTREILDFDELKKHLNSIYRTVKSSKLKRDKSNDLGAFVSDFVEGIEEGSILVDTGVNQGKKYRPATIKVWKEWKTQFEGFQKAKNITAHWDNIDMDFYYDYINYFNDKGYKENSTGKQIKHLKTIMRRGYEKGLHKNEIFRNKSFKTLQTETDTVTLKQSELDAIYNLDFSNNKQMDFHRDVFLIGCYTALRVSDVKSIQPANIESIDGRKYITIRTQKTDELVKVPIKPLVDNILKKYDYKIPNVTDNYLNRDIKEICKMAGLTDEVIITINKGGAKENQIVPKYKMVSSHTARRTGATLMYKNKMDSFQIRQITGHKKEASLLRYINISKDENAKILSENSFFN